MKKRTSQEIGHILSLVAVIILGVAGMISFTGLLKYMSTFMTAYGIASLMLAILKKGPYRR